MVVERVSSCIFNLDRRRWSIRRAFQKVYLYILFSNRFLALHLELIDRRFRPGGKGAIAAEIHFTGTSLGVSLTSDGDVVDEQDMGLHNTTQPVNPRVPRTRFDGTPCQLLPPAGRLLVQLLPPRHAMHDYPHLTNWRSYRREDEYFDARPDDDDDDDDDDSDNDGSAHGGSDGEHEPHDADSTLQALHGRQGTVVLGALATEIIVMDRADGSLSTQDVPVPVTAALRDDDHETAIALDTNDDQDLHFHLNVWHARFRQHGLGTRGWTCWLHPFFDNVQCLACGRTFCFNPSCDLMAPDDADACTTTWCSRVIPAWTRLTLARYAIPPEVSSRICHYVQGTTVTPTTVDMVPMQPPLMEPVAGGLSHQLKEVQFPEPSLQLIRTGDKLFEARLADDAATRDFTWSTLPSG